MRTRKKYRVFLFVCFVLLANLIFSPHIYCYSQDTKKTLIDIHYKRAIKLYKNRELDRAQEEFERVMELEPSHSKAQKYINVIIKRKNKEAIFALYDEAKKFTRTRQYQKASDTYRKVLEIIPKDGYSKFQIEILDHKIEKINKRNERMRAAQEKRKKRLEQAALKRELKKIKKERRKAKTVPLVKEQYAEEEAIVMRDKENQRTDKAMKSVTMAEDLERISTILDREKIGLEGSQKKEYNFTVQFTKEEAPKDKEQGVEGTSSSALKQLEFEMIDSFK